MLDTIQHLYTVDAYISKKKIYKTANKYKMRKMNFIQK